MNNQPQPTLRDWIKKNKGLTAAIVIGVLLLLGSLAKQDKQPDYDTATTTSAKAKGQWDAYGICTQVAREKYGAADFNLDEATDMGDGDWIVKGTADIPGRRIYWTGQVKYDPSSDTWDLKGWTDR